MQPWDYKHKTGGSSLDCLAYGDMFESAGTVFGSRWHIAAGTIYTAPFFVGDRSLNVSRASIPSNWHISNPSAIIGIYSVSNPSNRDLFPKDLIHEFSAFSIKNGSSPYVKYSPTVTPGTLVLANGFYWIAVVFSLDWIPVVRYGASGISNPLGTNATGHPYTSFEKVATYTSLPSTFPSMASGTTVSIEHPLAMGLEEE